MKKFYLSIIGLLFICLSIQAQPINDNCDNATILTDLDDFCANYSSAGYTYDGENSACGGNLTPANMWFGFTAVGTFLDLVVTPTGNEIPVINVFEVGDIADPCNTLANVWCTETGIINNVGGVMVGTQYLFYVSFLDNNGASVDADFEMCIHNGDPQANTDWCLPTPLIQGQCATDQDNAFSSIQNLGAFAETCPGGWESQLWYSTTLTDPNHILQVEVSPAGTNPIDGDVMIVVIQLTGPCPSNFFLEGSACGPATLDFELFGLESGVEYLIGVASSEENEGTFDVCIDHLGPDPCVLGEGTNDCGGTSPVLMPSTPAAGTTPNWECMTNQCIDLATPYDDFNFQTLCGFNFTNSTVWYQITTDGAGVIMNIDVQGTNPEMSYPAVALIQADCDAPAVVDCNAADGGAVQLANLSVNVNTTYYLAITNLDGNTGTFDLCVNTFLPQNNCNNDYELLEDWSSVDESPEGGPYCPGEEVRFCFTVLNFDASTAGSNCQWFQSIVPSFGDGWDPASFDAATGEPLDVDPPTGLHGGQWSWYPDNSVHYNLTNGLIHVYTGANGLNLCSPVSDPDCNGTPLAAGVGLPGGWYGIKPDGNPPDNHPDVAYGDGAGCNNSNDGTWEVCFTLTARSYPDCQSEPTYNDCTVSVIGFPDGETGSWTAPNCIGVIPDPIVAFVECTDVPIIFADDQEICTGQTINISLTSDQDPLTYNWTVDAPAGISGAADGDGTLINQTLVNNTSDPLDVIYNIVGKKTSCPGLHEVVVTVYPEIIVSDGMTSGCALQNFDLGSLIGVNGGSGIYFYQWSNGSSSSNPSVQVNEDATFDVTITDDVGCSGVGTVTITISELYDVEIAGPTELCARDMPATLEAVPQGGETPHQSYLWIFPDGSEQSGTTVEADQAGSYTVTVEDAFGCPGIGEFDLVVFPDPEIIEIIAPDLLCENGAEILVIATVADGTQPYEYSWQTPVDYTEPIGNNNQFMTDVPGMYVLTITDDNLCFTVDSFLVEESPAPSADTATLSACFSASGESVFDLTSVDELVNGGTGNIVYWYGDVGLSMAISDPENYLSGPGTIYAVVEDAGTACISEPAAVSLIFEAEIEGENAMTSICNQGNNEGFIDLTAFNSVVSNSPGAIVEWFEDTDFLQLISDPANFSTGSNTVYARLTQGDCSTDPLALVIEVVTELSSQADSLTACLEVDGMGTFDLSDAMINNNSGSTYTINWYSDINASVPVNTPDSYRLSAGQVYGIIVDADGCVSAVTPVDLFTDTLLMANEASAMACAELDGMGTFDLTTLNATITGPQSLNVIWFEDGTASTQISDPTVFRTSGTTVYATVSDGTCVANLAPVTLEVVTDLVANTDTLEACDPGTGIGEFNLEDGNPVVSGGQGTAVLWFTDEAKTNQIVDPGNYSSSDAIVYAVLLNGDCASDPVEVVLDVDYNLDAFSPDTLDACDPGTNIGTFNLTDRNSQVNGGTSMEVLWFTDAATTNEITDPANYDSAPGSVWAIVKDGDCISLAVEMILTVSVNLASNPGTLEACDEGGDIGTFDLTAADDQIRENSSFVVRYYSDAAASNEISDPTQYVSGDGIVYAIVFDGACRSEIALLSLEVEIDVFPRTDLVITECDEGGDISTFNLDDYMDDLLAEATDVEWFEDVALTSAISNSSAYVSGERTVYAVISRGNCISAAVPVQLEIEIVLDAGDSQIETCDEGGGRGTFDLSKFEGDITGGLSVSVEWFEDAAMSSPIGTTTAFVADDGDVIYARITDGRCVSALKAYTLSVTNNLRVSAATVRACDNGDGTGNFNLDGAVTTINEGLGYDVEFYSDLQLTQIISNTGNYVSADGIIYAITIDGLCRSLPVEITLDVIDEIVANQITETLCDVGDGTAIFDLDALAVQVDNGQGLQVLWYGDELLSMPLSSSDLKTGSTSIWTVLTNGNCDSDPVEIILTVITIPAAETDVFECDEGTGTGTFDLTSVESIIDVDGGHQVLWFEDALLTQALSNTSNYVAGNSTIYAIVTDGTCNSLAVAIDLIITNDLDAFASSISACDDGDGTVLFDLSTIESDINGGSGLDVVWFEDANGSTTLTGETAYESASKTVYAKVVDGNCQSLIVNVTIAVDPLPVADAGSPMTITCAESVIEIGGNTTSSGAEFSYSWTTSDGNIVSGNDQPNANIDAPGTYQLEVTNTLTSCLSIQEVTIDRDVELPAVDAGPDASLTCLDPEISIGTTNTETGTNYRISWMRDGSDLGQSAPLISISTPGVYVLNSENLTTGCKNSDTVIVVDEQLNLSGPVLDVLAPNCNGVNSGCIELTSVSGGTPPYSYSVNGQDYVSNEPICELGAGNYTVSIRDANGCETSIQATISEPVALQVSLHAPELVEYGDTALIYATHIPENRTIQSYMWTADDWFSTSLDSVILTYGLYEYPVMVRIEDENGCIAEDEIIVYVRKNFKIFAPSVFSPFNSGGINDKFMLFGDPNIVTNVDLIQIYSRWGDKLFERRDLDINDENAGWDGTFKGERMLPGAYIYYAEVTFIDGTKDFITGDVNILD